MALRAITGISLCSGIGGIDLGLRLAIPQYRCVCYVEREAYAAALLVARMEDEALHPAPIWDDVKSFDGRPWRGRVDIIHAGYPCFVAGTLVMARDGYRPIETLSVGDEVLTHRGRWRRVTSAMRRDGADLREVRAHGCSPITTTDEHPFYTRGGEWRKAADLKRGDRVAQVLPPIRSDERPVEFWWVVGRYLADGWRMCSPSQRGKGRVVICASHDEADDVEAKLRAAGFNPYASQERTVVKFHITRKWFYEFLEPFGHGADGKRVPGFALELDTERADALLTGYLSGDGYRASNPRGRGGYWRATTVSEALVLGVALLAQRARGVVASIRRYQGKPRKSIEGREVNQRPQWFVTIPDRNRSAVVEGDYGWKMVRSSDRSGRGAVYNIAVEEDESYIAGGAIVHNCQPFSAAGLRRGEEDPRHLWPSIFRIVEEVGPALVFCENVPPHLRIGFDAVVQDMERLGYDVAAGVFTAWGVGAPHIRERLFWLGRRRGALPDTDGDPLRHLTERGGERAPQEALEGNPIDRDGGEDRDSTYPTGPRCEELSGCASSGARRIHVEPIGGGATDASEHAGRDVQRGQRERGGSEFAGVGLYRGEHGVADTSSSGSGTLGAHEDSGRASEGPRRGGDHHLSGAGVSPDACCERFLRGEECDRRDGMGDRREEREGAAFRDYALRRGLFDWSRAPIPVLMPEHAREGRETQPRVRGVDDGRSYRVDRLQGLGNAVVPSVVARAFAVLFKELDGVVDEDW